MKKFEGKVFFIDRDNINTDEIIPAKYLTLIDKEPLKTHLLEDLKMEGLTPSKIEWSNYGAIISRSNFGCGSSREAAPWAFEVNGINIIIASNFARIFRENTFNCGMLAIELDSLVIEKIFLTFKDENNVNLELDIETMKMKLTSEDKSEELEFELNKFQKDLVLAGGWVELAAKKY
ncbi:MAG: 3-isopropylmalate dehydratase small subunit [archaeon]|nr:3-isopropylmalate dehydratase small subunit [archaeon]